MAKFVLLFACVGLLHVASALKCYTCEKDQCKEDMKSWVSGECGKSADVTQESVCQKMTYKDANGNKVISRKCVLAPLKATEITCPTMDGAKDIKCPICRTDLCNSASSVSVSFATFAGIMALLLCQKYFL